ncbi:MAG TPA: MEDS domain-containing protein [Verrucomicrobiae bacterium]|jgi:signal transduction histidine kinase/CheY-like chemotaxis protein|nr:MEDS domain-containing protein [Verrucomicrobiae bacterium]
MLKLLPGDHLCLFYEKDPAEQMPALLPFIQEALAAGEQFVYVADDHTINELSERLRQGGIDVSRECDRGALKLWTRRDWRQPGKLSAAKKSRQVLQLIEEATKSGFKASRFAVEMTWTLGPDIDNRLLEQWEAALNTIFVPDFPGKIVCQYNRSRLSPEAIFAALRTHPLAIIRDDAYSNLFYEAPLILYGNQKSSGARVEWMLSQLKRARAVEKEREELIRQRSAVVEAERGRAKLEKLNEELERRVAERNAELITANAALLKDMEERKTLEEQLRQAQKMESMGTLAGGIAHDFNNILNIIQGYSSLIGSHASDGGEIAEGVKVINEAIKRGAAVVQQLLTIARKADANLERTDLNALVSSLAELIKGTFPKNIEVNLQLAKDLPSILADPDQISQALLNLCVNARDAMPGGGRLMLKTAIADRGALKLNGNANVEQFVSIEIADGGGGMEESVRSRVFEPFFTTKESNKGTGLGLSVVYGIVKNHHGVIEVESTRGRGSTFRIALPVFPLEASEEYRAADHASNGSDKTVDRSATALIVEDEESTLHLLRNLLVERGYRVFTAIDGEEAAARYCRNADDIDVVLLDLDLPKMPGAEVLRKIRAKNPHARVLVTTGYLDPELKEALVREGVHHFIHKPYMLDEIIAVLNAEDNRSLETVGEIR